MRWISIFLILLLAPLTIAICTDSDGRDSSIRGHAWNSTHDFYDFCADDPDYKRLVEMICSRDSIEQIFIECEVMCYQGRCIDDSEKESLLRCRDSDKGLNPYEKGTVKGLANEAAGVSEFIDYCLPDGRLLEYYCLDGFVVMEPVDCDCRNGKCERPEGLMIYECNSGFHSHYRCYASPDSSGLCDEIKENIDDHACCESETSCVLAGKCYGNRHSGEGIAAFCEGGFWKDCDKDKEACEICGFDWAFIGKPYFFGGYHMVLEECCGDDPGEYYIEGLDGTGACCDNPQDSVVGGICYANKEEPKKNLTELHNQLQAMFRHEWESHIDNNEDKPLDSPIDISPAGVDDIGESNYPEVRTDEESEDGVLKEGFFLRILMKIRSIFG